MDGWILVLYSLDVVFAVVLHLPPSSACVCVSVGVHVCVWYVCKLCLSCVCVRMLACIPSCVPVRACLCVCLCARVCVLLLLLWMYVHISLWGTVFCVCHVIFCVYSECVRYWLFVFEYVINLRICLLPPDSARNSAKTASSATIEYVFLRTTSRYVLAATVLFRLVLVPIFISVV